MKSLDEFLKNKFPVNGEELSTEAAKYLIKYVTLYFGNLRVQVGDRELSSEDVMELEVIPEIEEMINEVCKYRELDSRYFVQRASKRIYDNLTGAKDE